MLVPLCNANPMCPTLHMRLAKYLHMQKFAKGIGSGVQVKQGQVIGYVGSTGLATGPHVCFRFWKNGKQPEFCRLDTWHIRHSSAQSVRVVLNLQFEPVHRWASFQVAWSGQTAFPSRLFSIRLEPFWVLFGLDRRLFVTACFCPHYLSCHHHR